ncbi:SPOR domain-containing protein [Alteromonas facilis]|uniref:SPOR domain-containing protein n=1 Tax=Alteromonas facilis TaxID=2048004 RepID=UPI000C29352D|nr:SPOR domain-containing protein [Alteromonas facilis]
MPQKDYVKRGRAPKNTQPEKRSLPWINISVALALIVGFVYVLWQIKDNAPEPTPQEALPEVIAQEPEDDLPELPKEEWEFIKTLPGYEVEVEEVEQITKRYLMQCGSFRSEAQAQEMRAKIAFTGMESMVRQSDGSNGRWYRVVLGPFESKRDAERSRHQLRDINIRTCQIWYWNL